MWIFLLSDAFSFSGLLMAYGILRGSSEIWACTPGVLEKLTAIGRTCGPVVPEFGIPFTAALTFLLICSSVTMVLAHAAAVEGNRKGILFFLGLTILGGLLFLLGQYQEYFGLFHFLGHGLTNEGLNFGETHYATTFYLITSFHGLHVATGVLILIIMFIRTLMGKYDGGNHDHIEVAGLFWHFVDFVWILVFTFIYLIPHYIPEAS